MGHRVQLITMVSILIMMTATISLGYEYEWSPEMMLTWNSKMDANPSIIQTSDGKIWVAWHSYRTGNADIFYKVYDSSQVHPWSSEKNLTTDSNTDITPSVMQASDGKIWVVWSANRTGNYEIYYKTSSDNGATWSPDNNCTANSKDDEWPSIMQAANGTIWLAWSANRTGNYEIYYKTSSDNGATWSPDRFLNYSETNDRNPSITQATNGMIWFVWVREKDLKLHIWFRTYNATSNIWSSSTTQVTFDSGGTINSNPSVMQSNDGKIWFVWDTEDKVSGQADIYYQTRSPPLFSASSIIKLIYSSEDDVTPSIVQAADGNIWMTWATVRFSNWDIRYLTTKMPQPNDVAIFCVSPTEVTVSADQTVFIEVVAQNHGNNSENFTVILYANSTPINQSTIGLSPGQLYALNLTWAASSAGTYKIWANASVVYGEIYTVDNAFPAIVGDVNGDRAVNASDLSIFSSTYGSKSGDSNWNPNCNLDGFSGNNIVGVLDLFYLGKNYGKSQ